jgi:hypothetical protein
VYGFVPDALEPGVTPRLAEYYKHVYQWYLPDHRFTVTRTGDYPEDAYVFAPVHEPKLENEGACIVWRDPAAAMALWFVNDCPG